MLVVGRRAFSVSNCRLALVRREDISCGLERELLWSCERILVSVDVDMVGSGKGEDGVGDNERLVGVGLLVQIPFNTLERFSSVFEYLTHQPAR